MDAEAERPSPALRPILVVDDDPVAREVLAELLDDEGYTVITASNGQEALELLAKIFEPCVVLLDIEMPLKSGLDVLAEVRRQRARGMARVILATGSDEPAPPEADAVLRKPIDVGKLLEAVERFAEVR